MKTLCALYIKFSEIKKPIQRLESAFFFLENNFFKGRFNSWASLEFYEKNKREKADSTSWIGFYEKHNIKTIIIIKELYYQFII